MIFRIFMNIYDIYEIMVFSQMVSECVNSEQW